MSDDNQIPKTPPAMLVELHVGPDGKSTVDVHGPTCPRTREVHRAMLEGAEPPPRGAPGSRCGPAMVSTEAFRDGWTSIFGQRQTTGQA